MKRDRFEKVLNLARKSKDGESDSAWVKVRDAYRKADDMAQASLDHLIAPGEWHRILGETTPGSGDWATSSGEQPDCRTCRFADLEADLCRRTPPTALVAREELHQGFPNIFPGSDWCWEWLHRPDWRT